MNINSDKLEINFENREREWSKMMESCFKGIQENEAPLSDIVCSNRLEELRKNLQEKIDNDMKEKESMKASDTACDNIMERVHCVIEGYENFIVVIDDTAYDAGGYTTYESIAMAIGRYVLDNCRKELGYDTLKIVEAI